MEYWNYGILGFEHLGCWSIEKIFYWPSGGISKNENPPLRTTFHYSTIPIFLMCV